MRQSVCKGTDILGRKTCLCLTAHLMIVLYVSIQVIVDASCPSEPSIAESGLLQPKNRTANLVRLLPVLVRLHQNTCDFDTFGVMADTEPTLVV